MPKKYASMEERLLANSVISEERFHNGTPCWIWISKIGPGGYPYISMRYKHGPRKGKVRSVRAHRLAIVVFKGRRMTPKMVAKHLCNNRACINPEHLQGGSQKSNMKQCVREGRHKTPFRDPHKRRAM